MAFSCLLLISFFPYFLFKRLFQYSAAYLKKLHTFILCSQGQNYALQVNFVAFIFFWTWPDQMYSGAAFILIKHDALGTGAELAVPAAEPSAGWVQQLHVNHCVVSTKRTWAPLCKVQYGWGCALNAPWHTMFSPWWAHGETVVVTVSKQLQR